MSGTNGDPVIIMIEMSVIRRKFNGHPTPLLDGISHGCLS